MTTRDLDAIISRPTRLYLWCARFRIPIPAGPAVEEAEKRLHLRDRQPLNLVSPPNDQPFAFQVTLSRPRVLHDRLTLLLLPPDTGRPGQPRSRR